MVNKLAQLSRRQLVPGRACGRARLRELAQCSSCCCCGALDRTSACVSGRGRCFRDSMSTSRACRARKLRSAKVVTSKTVMSGSARTASCSNRRAGASRVRFGSQLGLPADQGVTHPKPATRGLGWQRTSLGMLSLVAPVRPVLALAQHIPAMNADIANSPISRYCELISRHFQRQRSTFHCETSGEGSGALPAGPSSVCTHCHRRL